VAPREAFEEHAPLACPPTLAVAGRGGAWEALPAVDGEASAARCAAAACWQREAWGRLLALPVAAPGPAERAACGAALSDAPPGALLALSEGYLEGEVSDSDGREVPSGAPIPALLASPGLSSPVTAAAAAAEEALEWLRANLERFPVIRDGP